MARLLNGLLDERLDDKGLFDELVSKEPVMVHLEMMDDATLWGGFYRPGSHERVTIWIGTKRGKLAVIVREEK